MILALVLVGIAAGALSASAWEARARSGSFASWVAYAAGFAGLVGYLGHPFVLGSTLEPYQGAWTVLRVSSVLVLPVSFGSGALFTLLGSGLRAVSGTDARAAGALVAVNTLGAGVGPLLAGFVLLPRFGMERSLFGLLALYGVIGLVLSFSVPSRPVLRY